MPEFAAKRARERPEEVALRDARQALTWSELDRQLNCAANALRETELGAARRVAVFAENHAETVLAHLGGLLASASTVPVNFHLTPAEVAYILSESDAQLLFVGPETAEAGVKAARQAGVPQVIGWNCEGVDGVRPFRQWLDAASPAPPPLDLPPRPNLMFTSGTTGRPKATELPPTMFAAGRDLAEHLAQLAKTAFARLGPHLVVGPLYHTGPLSGARGLAGGAPLVVLGRFDAENTLRAIARYRIESTVMVPTHFVRLLQLPEEQRAQFDVSSLKLVFHTGARCPVEVKRRMLEWWRDCIYEAYGATEVGTTCSIGPDDWLAHPGSVGRPNPPFEALVVDESGAPLPPGAEGRLYFRDSTGRGVVYHNDAAKSAAAHLRPGVFTLGEIGYVDEEGFVYITDRFSDMVISGGVNIYPAESEQVLALHPDVVDVACIGVPHAEMGEELRALVVRRPGSTLSGEALVQWCRARLSHYKCPRSAEFVADLGRSAAGKVDKRKLRDAHLQAHSEAPWAEAP